MNKSIVEKVLFAALFGWVEESAQSDKYVVMDTWRLVDEVLGKLDEAGFVIAERGNDG